jgi:hypothetical protein
VTGDTERGDQAIHLARTARHLSAIALHLKSGELTLTRLATTDRPDTAFGHFLLTIAGAATTAAAVLGLLAERMPQVADIGIPVSGGFALGVATVNLMLRGQRDHTRTRPPPEEPSS